MTIPHQVQRAILRGFFRRRPELGEAAARFFKDQQLFFKDDNGKLVDLRRPDTGSPLGMFVEGYTIFQYALHEINLSHISAPAKSFMFSATNDDMVVGSRNREHLVEYNDADIRNNSALGMSYKDTKSGISRDRFVYCEEYWIDDHIDPKSALFAVTLIGAKSCFSAFHAKEYAHAVMLSAGEVTPEMMAALREVQSSVGSEFHDDEFDWPYLFGGWLPQKKNGLDYSIEWFNGDLRAVSGYWANRVKLPRKGRLDDVPHLSIGRKLGLKLITEPEDPENWIDLVPFFGTKKTLERHYRTSIRHPKSVMNEYLLLSKLRREAYEQGILGKRDLPSVQEGWLRRHPDSMIPETLPIRRKVTAFTRVTQPRMGVKERSLVHKLLAMRKKGYIDFDGHGIISATTIQIAESGFQDACSYNYLPITEGGISALVLQEHLRGLQDFYERTGLMIACYDDKDYQVKETELWGYMPWASFLTTCRQYKYGRQYFNGALNQRQLVALAEVHRQVSRIEHDPQADEDDFDIDAKPSEAVSLIGELVRDVIRDWESDPDAIIKGMAHRIKPRNDPSIEPDILMRLGMMRSETVSLFPDFGSGQGDNDKDETGSNASSIFEDPWAELGV
jgi:hypothetical protein